MSFYDILFCAFCFYIFFIIVFKQLYVFALNPTNLFMIKPLSSPFISPITVLLFPRGNSLSISKFEVSNLFSISSGISL